MKKIIGTRVIAQKFQCPVSDYGDMTPDEVLEYETNPELGNVIEALSFGETPKVIVVADIVEVAE
jgi:hypothetical protein